jgi:ligand-binding SRPBCC domain-containing protein
LLDHRFGIFPQVQTIGQYSMAQFEARVQLPHTREHVFDFLIRTANLLAMIPPDSGMQAVSVPEVIKAGSLLEFQLKQFGQSSKIVHEITQFVAPSKVAERQVQGLFKLWIHEHLVEEAPAGEVVAIDRIEFEPPGGMLGFLVTKRRILDELESLFAHRHAQMRKMLALSSPYSKTP